jgi:fatty-acyl-CoA synthase
MNGNATARPSTLTELLGQATQRHPERVALVEGGTQVTYAELTERSTRLADGLAAAGIRRGDSVAVWLPNRAEWVELVLALGRLGAIAVGVNTRYRSREVLHVLATSGAVAMVVESGFKGIDFVAMLDEVGDELPASLTTLIDIADEADRSSRCGLEVLSMADLKASERCLDEDHAAADLPSNAFSSSGTTGAPKLVLHQQQGIVAHSIAVAASFGYHADDTVVLAALPMCGVFGFNTVLASLAAGATTVLLPEFVAADAIRTMRTHRVTHTNLADEMLRRIVEEPGALGSLTDWRECGFGAFTAVDPVELVSAGEAHGKKFFQTFGSSEVQALMTYPADTATVDRRSRGGGVPVAPSIQVQVRADDGTLCPVGETGEIEVRGPNVTCGYYGIEGIPDLDDNGFFRTGDLGRMVDAHDVEYLARRGDALRLAGFLVSPREIEAFLEDLDGVSGAQVVGVDLAHDTIPVAFLTAEPGRTIDVAAVVTAASRELAGFKVPRHVEVLDEFPETKGTNGNKIQRTILRERAAAALLESSTTKGDPR